MYPETDVVSISVTPEYLNELKSKLPEMPDAKLNRLTKDYDLNKKLATQVINSEYCDLFEQISSKTQVAPTVIAVALTETLKSLKRDGVEVDTLSDDTIHRVFDLLDNGLTVKESLPDIFKWLSSHANRSPGEALKELGLELMKEEELSRIVELKVKENMELVERMGGRAIGPIMGMVMGEVRGRVNAEDVLTLLREVLARASPIR